MSGGWWVVDGEDSRSFVFSIHHPPPTRKGPAKVPDEVIGGYRLQNLMMTGQTSQVWEVVEVSSHRHFAMKLLLPEKARDHLPHLGRLAGGHVLEQTIVAEDLFRHGGLPV